MGHIHTARRRVRATYGRKNYKRVIFITVVMGMIIAFFLMLLAEKYELHPLEMDVTDASLTQFNITTTANDTLHYRNLALNITLRNLNKYFRIYYDYILVVADYQNRRWFAMPIRVAEFLQPEKKITSLKVQLSDNNITDDDVANAGSPNYYNIVVKLHLGITYKFIPKCWLDQYWNSLFTCSLKVPLKINGSQSANMTTSAFETTKCKYDHNWYN
ncbi:hypothetical protein M0R45_027902 [Rubus argutus]|uniref:Late embryogenesis abundant protein LEA-2 subgroup domain-containing protein n=1 Tax=Rubus argutus TaxID=59490 RepID=A0AAW1W3Q6_RUBAR